MIAVCLPQPWAGLVLAGQVKHINTLRYTSYRGELVIYASGDMGDTIEPYKYVDGLMDVTDAYLGVVNIHDAQDPYEVDLSPYLGLGWWWKSSPYEMMQQPVDAVFDHRWGESFIVPDRHRDTIDAMRLGWSAWMDRYLEQISANNHRAKEAPNDD